MKAQTWTATLKLDNICESNLPRRLKINFFRATVESILFYCAETWTMTKELNKELDGTYTRLLRQTLNINWRQHITNEELYADLRRISETIKKRRRLRLAGHCWRSNNTDKRSLEDQNWTTPLSCRKTQAQQRGIGYNDE